MADKYHPVLLERAVDQLPERQQIVYQLTRQQEMKKKDVADELHIGSGLSKQYITAIY